MTSKTTTLIRRDGRLDRFPDFPPREDMQNTKHLHLRSVLTTLLIHFADRERTLVHGEVPVAPTLDPWRDYRIPDLIVAFGCDLDLVSEQRGYAIDCQGLALDWVLLKKMPLLTPTPMRTPTQDRSRRVNLTKTPTPTRTSTSYSGENRISDLKTTRTSTPNSVYRESLTWRPTRPQKSDPRSSE